MTTVLESVTLRLPARTPGPSGPSSQPGPSGPSGLPGPCATIGALGEPAIAAPEAAWLTATVRPAGTFGYGDTERLRALLDALSGCASIVVLDLQAARLRTPRAGEVVEDAASDIERHGGCLMCINVDAESRECLSAAGDHAVLMQDGSPLAAVG
jgi:hypothetical protein